MTTSYPDNSTSVSVYSSGRLSSVTRKDSTGTQIGATSYGYDAHGRQNQSADARNGTTTLTFNAMDQVGSTLTPDPGNGGAAEFTTNLVHQMGRITETILPDVGLVTNQWSPMSLLLATGGARSYPVVYFFDAQGRMLTMTTWTNYAANAGSAQTSWYYDGLRGWLTNKVYADSNGTKYSYTSAGRLATRKWSRGSPQITTTYGYNVAGDLATISYNDSVTSGATNTYDRRGRLATVVQNGAVWHNLWVND